MVVLGGLEGDTPATNSGMAIFDCRLSLLEDYLFVAKLRELVKISGFWAVGKRHQSLIK